LSFEQFILIFAVATIGATYGIMFGGGSIIILPTLFLLGFDPKVAIASNLTAILVQLITGFIEFYHYKRINFSVIKQIIIFHVLGAIIGAFILLQIEGVLIKKIIAIAIIFFAVFSLFNQQLLIKARNHVSCWKKIAGSVASFFNGIYQIAVNAGAGIISTFILIYFYGLNLKGAIGTKQLIHFSSVSIGALILASQGLVNWYLVIPLAFGRLLGALLGTQIIIKTRSTILSVVFSIVVMLLALRILFF
jgi:uncharacterized membrane protein YfcA